MFPLSRLAHKRTITRRWLLLVFLLAAVLVQPAPALALDGLQWSWIDPQPAGAGLYRVIYADNQFVAVGEAETILTSPNGTDWTVRRTNYGHDAFDVVDVAWGNNRYVAIGRFKGTGLSVRGEVRPVESFVPLTSTDGVSWTLHRDRQGFASAASGSLIRDSSNAQLAFDGVQFVLRVEPTASHPFFMVSDDGLHWESSPNYDPGAFPRSHPSAPGPLARGNGIWLSVRPTDNLSTWTIWTSQDGQSWSGRLKSPSFFDVAFGRGIFVAVGAKDGADRHGYLMTSQDGLAWTQQVSQLSPQGETEYRAAAFGNGVTVIGGQKKAVVLNAVLQATVVPFEENIVDVAFTKGLFVVIAQHEQSGSCGLGKVYTSPDGRTWTPRWEGKNCVMKILEVDDEVVIWANNDLLFSSDLINWEARELGLSGGIFRKDLTWGGGQFVLIYSAGPDDLVYTSPDGQTWTKHDPHINDEDFESINYANGLFVMGARTQTYVSKDALSWTFHKTALASPPENLYYLDGQYLGVGGYSLIYSGDGMHWRTEEVLGRPKLTDIVSTGTHYVLVGNNRILAAEIPPCRPYFTDIVVTEPACKPAETLYRYGVVTGYEDGSFRPGSQVTRAEIAKMVTVALGQYPNPTGRVTFQDVAGHWSLTQGYLQAAVELGVIGGYNAEQFGPNDQLTRAQLIKITAAALGLSESGTPTHSGVPGWANGWVATAEKANLIGAQAPFPIWTDGNLNGDAPVTRAEAATLLANMLNLMS